MSSSSKWQEKKNKRGNCSRLRDPGDMLLSCQVVSNSFATPWTAACQAPLFLGFPKEEYWSGLPFPSPKGLFPTQGSDLHPVNCRWIFHC